MLVIRREEESHCQNRERKKSVTGLEDSKKMITRLRLVFFLPFVKDRNSVLVGDS